QRKGQPAIFKDEHTVCIFELLANKSMLTVEAVIDHLLKEFRDHPQISTESHEEKLSPNLQAYHP
ncbi:hypothetical protein BY458DRAFT_443927, partial [Sporodiniella umbellata]